MKTLLLISWRAMRAHLSRMVLSVLAVVLGTAFVAGGFLLSASLSSAFASITANAFDDVDLVITSEERPLTDDDVELLRGLGGVDKVRADYYSGASILNAEGTPAQTGGAGAWVFNDTTATLIDGRHPTAGGEATLNDTTANSLGVTVGDTITVIDAVARTELNLVGITHYDDSTGGWAGVAVTTDFYRDTFDHGAGYFALMVTGDLTPADVPLTHVTIRTGAQAAADQTEAIEESLSFFTYVLAAFGAIALIVGTFIISNTFSMTVGQRTRDFALLRALGMSRTQLTTSVLAEAVLVGLVGSALGIVAGLGLVWLIQWAMAAAGFGFPAGGLGLTATSVGVPLAVGVFVTVISAYVPARRAGATHPVQAMRSGEGVTQHVPLRARTIAGAVVVLAGVAMMVAVWLGDGWDGTVLTVLTGAGVVAVLLGVLGVLPAMAHAVFSRVRVGGPVLRLAESSLSRNPKRTGGTTFALTMGVSLVVAVAVLGASASQSIYGAIDDELHSDAVVDVGMVSAQGIPSLLLEELVAIDGVDTMLPLYWLPVEMDGTHELILVLTQDPRDQLELTYLAGDPDPGVDGGVIVDKDHGLGVGDPITVGPITSTVVGVIDDNAIGISTALTMPLATELGGEPSQWYMNRIFLSYRDAGAHDEVTELVNSYGVLQIMDRAEFAEAGVAQAGQLMAVLYALLALSVVIAMLGVANTLALSIIERRQEIGSLRAVGMHRSQVRRMIVAESAQIALAGSILGGVLGVMFGVTLTTAMSDGGLTELVVPAGQVVAILVAAVVLGTAAGLLPARRAARVAPLEAVG